MSQERERGTFPLRDAKIDLARRHVPVVVLFCSMLKKRDGEHDHGQLSLSNFYPGSSRTIFRMPRKYKTWETPKQIARNGMSSGIQDPQLLYDACWRALFSVTNWSRQATMLLFVPLELLYKFFFLQLRVYHPLHYSRLYNLKNDVKR